MDYSRLPLQPHSPLPTPTPLTTMDIDGNTQNSIFRLPLPHISTITLRTAGIYLSGVFYSLAFYSLLDSALFSKSNANGSIVHVTFADWLPFVVSSLGMLIINIIDKSRLSLTADFSHDQAAEWSAKIVLFLGFACLAGGLAGSIVILVLKYVVPKYPFPTLGMGVLNVVANGSVMVSSIFLWLAQNLEDEYSYNLQL